MGSLIDGTDIALVSRMVLAHVVVDFVLQPGSFVAQRVEGKWTSWWLYVHGVLAGVLVYLFAGQWSGIWILPVVAVSHIGIDGLKSMARATGRAFVLDQVGHIIVILGCWGALMNSDGVTVWELVRSVVASQRLWVVVLAYAIVVWPGGVIVGRVAESWTSDMAQGKESGLKKAGLLIGRLERTLILTFVLYQQYEAIGFLIAAKSIFRFGGGDSSLARRETEYFLVGTLISFVIAILAGVMANMVLARVR